MRVSCLLLALALPSVAPAVAGESPTTVVSKYPSICAGALRHAVLSDLEDGVIAECEDIKVTVKVPIAYRHNVTRALYFAPPKICLKGCRIRTVNI